MKKYVAAFLFLRIVAAFAAAVVYLPRINVYPNALRPNCYFTRKPLLTREKNPLDAALAASLEPSGPDSLWRPLADSPALFFEQILFFHNPIEISIQTQVRRALSFIQLPPEVMLWFSLLGWYP